MNIRFIVGNLTRDPEMNYTPSGMAVTKFCVATNEYAGKDRNTGNSMTTTLFNNVVVFGDRAETVATWLKKGSKVAVIGTHTERKYADRNGVEKVWIEIKANEVDFLSDFKSKDEVHGYVPGSGGGASPEHVEGEAYL